MFKLGSFYYRLLWCFCFVLLASLSYAQDALVTPQPDEILIGPLALTQDLGNGVVINVRASSFINAKTENNALHFKLRLVVDLTDLQAKSGAIIDTIPLPTNNCGHFGVDNLVARIWGKRLGISGNTARMDLNGDVDVWTCAKNPVPCSRVDWEPRRIGPITTNVPVVKLYDCNPPIKNRNVNQPFNASLPFQLVVVDPKTVGVKLETPSVSLGGTLGGVTTGILKIAGVDLNGRVKAALDRAINPELLQKSIPQEYLQLNPDIKVAKLFDNNGSLAATIEMSAIAEGGNLTQFLETILKSAKPQQ
jgi:hypothetical protein